VQAEINSDNYTDPAAGKQPFRDYSEDVVANRAIDAGTTAKRQQRMAKHVYPVIGTTPLRALSRRPSLVQSLIASMERAGLEASTVGVVMADVSMVFNAAIDDGLVTKNPCRASSVTLPTAEQDELVPWTAEQVAAVRAALPARFAAMVDCGAGVGLRQGEIFALSPDDVEWLSPEPVVHVRHQVKALKGGMVFDLPKGRKTRAVPLSPARKIALAEHMRLHPPVEVTLPWRRLDGKPTKVRLFFTHTQGRPLERADFNRDSWKPAVRAAGLPVGPYENTMHDLRHYFAAVLLTEGESPKALSRWLGHGSVTTTMKYYAHFMPQSDARMRRIIDEAMEPASEDAEVGPGRSAPARD